ncbi:MAG: hypothetical protein JW734_08420 [Candidatus Omnitrophica bacterium]|nr:hypothetical protein [Candidatus Omnitrophota bacterium]
MAKKKAKIKILVTAGPTWVRLDKVRVLTSIFSGATGALTARVFKDKGYRVSLLLGPTRFPFEARGITVLRFKYFEDLQQLLKEQLKDKAYRVVIHSAAVSDYKPYKVQAAKIPSSKKSLLVRLKPAPKLIKQIRKTREDVFLIQFKLEVNKTRKALINAAFRSLVENKSDIVVANDLKDFKGLRSKAYVIDADKNVGLVKNRRALVNKLLQIVDSRFC